MLTPHFTSNARICRSMSRWWQIAWCASAKCLLASASISPNLALSTDQDSSAATADLATWPINLRSVSRRPVFVRWHAVRDLTAATTSKI
jgi:hypothetical protein